MSKIPLSVILMVHNEEETIGNEIKRYYHEIIKKMPHSEFIIAEDGSKDKTREILFALKKKYSLRLLATPEKRGYATSLHLAFNKARGNLIFYADAGGKHEPKDFWKLYEKIKKYDLVTGYKKKRNDPWYRIFLTWGLNTTVALYFGVSFKDIDCGFKLLNRNKLKKLFVEQWTLKDNVSLEVVLKAVYAGFKTTEVPIKHNARKFGPSRGLPLKKIPKVIIRLLLAYPELKRNLLKLRTEN